MARHENNQIVGLVVPEPGDAVPVETAAMYPGATFVAHGIGLQSLSTSGYDEAIGRVIPAGRALASLGAKAIMVVGASLTFYRGAAFNRSLTEESSASTGLRVATMSSALVDGLDEVGARRIAVVTAYTDAVNGMLATFLRECGFEVLSLEVVGVANRVGDAARVSEDDIFAASVTALDTATNADGILIVCGGLRTLGVTPRIEAHCGVPVVSSMPAAIRKAAQLAGASAQLPHGYGRLLSGVQQRASP